MDTIIWETEAAFKRQEKKKTWATLGVMGSTVARPFKSIIIHKTQIKKEPRLRVPYNQKLLIGRFLQMFVKAAVLYI